MDERKQLPIIRPEPHVFADYTDEKFEQSVTTSENASVKKITGMHETLVYVTERVDYPAEGMLMRYQGVPFPRQGFAFPEATDGINNLKKVTVLFMAVLKGKGIKGRIGTFLAHYCWIADWMFQWYDPNSQKVRKIYLKDHRYRQSVRELIKLINNFLDYAGIEVKGKGASPVTTFGTVIGTMIEYDNAYHWRMEDIFAETSKELLLEDPRKELLRLLAIYESREHTGIEFKAQSIVKILRYALLIPSIKKAFRKAINSVDIEKMKMTKDDRYYALIYNSYDFEGKDIEIRTKEWLNMTDGVPPPRVTIPVQ